MLFNRYFSALFVGELQWELWTGPSDGIEKDAMLIVSPDLLMLLLLADVWISIVLLWVFRFPFSLYSFIKVLMLLTCSGDFRLGLIWKLGEFCFLPSLVQERSKIGFIWLFVRLLFFYFWVERGRLSVKIKCKAWSLTCRFFW